MTVDTNRFSPFDSQRGQDESPYLSSRSAIDADDTPRSAVASPDRRYGAPALFGQATSGRDTGRAGPLDRLRRNTAPPAASAGATMHTAPADAPASSHDMATRLVVTNDLAEHGQRFAEAMRQVQEGARKGDDITGPLIAAGNAFNDMYDLLEQQTPTPAQQQRIASLQSAMAEAGPATTLQSIEEGTGIALPGLHPRSTQDGYGTYGKAVSSYTRSLIFDEGRFNNSRVLLNTPLARFQRPGQSVLSPIGDNGRVGVLLGTRVNAAASNFTKAATAFAAGIDKLRKGQDATDDFLSAASATGQGVTELTAGALTDFGNHMVKLQGGPTSRQVSRPTSPQQTETPQRPETPLASETSQRPETPETSNGSQRARTPEMRETQQPMGTPQTSGAPGPQQTSQPSAPSAAPEASQPPGASPPPEPSETPGTSNASARARPQSPPSSQSSHTSESPRTPQTDTTSLDSRFEQFDANDPLGAGFDDASTRSAARIDAQVATRQHSLEEQVLRNMDGRSADVATLALNDGVDNIRSQWLGMRNLGTSLKDSLTQATTDAHDNLRSVDERAQPLLKQLKAHGFDSVDAARVSHDDVVKGLVAQLDEYGYLKEQAYDQFNHAMDERDAIMKAAPGAFDELDDLMRSSPPESRPGRLSAWADKYGRAFGKYRGGLLAKTDGFPDWFKISKPLRAQLIPAAINTAFGGIGLGAAIDNYVKKKNAGTLTTEDKLNLSGQVFNFASGLAGYIPVIGPALFLAFASIGLGLGGLAENWKQVQDDQTMEKVRQQIRSEHERRHPGRGVFDGFDGG